MQTCVLLVNLGTPDSYSNKDVRKYLDEFLSDPRVLDINPLARKLLLNFVILPFRTPKSAKLYKEIWTEKGSPLKYLGYDVKEKLQNELGADYVVELAMRYQEPSLDEALQRIKKAAYAKIIVLPLFPQYASASTGSVQEKIMKIISSWEVMPEMEFINSYCNHPSFINAWVTRAKEYNINDYDQIIFSYHGLPERQILKGDITGSHCLKPHCCESYSDKNYYCYRAQCFETTRQIAERLSLRKDQYVVTFQSRLGRDPWIKPYTDDQLRIAAQEGKKKLLVFAPAFVADCLETSYEIAVEYDELFKQLGGEKVQLVESLNTLPEWISALKDITLEHSAIGIK